MSKQELYLYRIVAELSDGQTLPIVVLSSSEEKAFVDAEKELERNYFPTPEVNEWVLEQKKRARQGAGFILVL